VAADPRALAELSVETLREIEAQAALHTGFFNTNRPIWFERRVVVGSGLPAQPGDPEVTDLESATAIPARELIVGDPSVDLRKSVPGQVVGHDDNFGPLC